MLQQLTRLSKGVTQVATATVLGLADAAGSMAAPVLERATAGLSPAGRMSAAFADAVGDLADAGIHRGRRRVWSRDGRAHVEVKGLTGQGHKHRRLSEDVTAALMEIKGVHWAEVNAVTQHVLLAFDEEAVDMDLIVECIESVEEEHGTEEESFSRERPDHPSSDAPITETAIILAVDLAGLGIAAAGRFFTVPTIPRGVRIPLVLAETYPRIRHTLDAKLGRSHSDLLLAVTNSALNAVTQGPAPLAVDGMHHFLKLVEARSRLAVWHRREKDLVGNGSDLPSETHQPVPRPVPLPHGPVERLGDRTTVAALLGAGGTLAFTRDPGQAADLMLAVMPKAARQGREAFASVLGWELARRGVVPMDPTALRRLDRITTIVIDSTALCTNRLRVLSAAATDTSTSDARIWQIAEEILNAPADSPRLIGSGPWTHGEWRLERAADAVPGDVASPVALTLDVSDADGSRRGRVRVGCEVDRLADSLLAAARSSARRIILTDHESGTDLLPWADEIAAADEPLADFVRGLQGEGEGVLVISVHDDDALHAADVGIAVVRGDDPVCWSADFLCGPGLDEVWRLLHAVEAAHRVSGRSARLALGGSALGALLVLTGGRRNGQRPGGALAPVHSAALAAVFGGAVTAYHLGRLEVPNPAVRGNWHDLTAEDAFFRLRQARLNEPDVKSLGQLAAAADVGRRVLHEAAALPLVARTVVGPARTVVALSGAIAEELHDPLTPVLAFGAAASAVVGSGVDAVLVGGVMAGNAVISGAQRLRAERALRRLLLGEQMNARRVDWSPGSEDEWHSALIDLTAATTETFPAEELEVGDVVKLGPADVVPADVRLLASSDLEVDESSLTGESMPVAKSAAPTPGAELDERSCMLYEGSTVLVGTGYAVVVAVGQGTEAGRAAAVAGSAAPPAGIGARLAELTRIALPVAGVGGLAVTGISALGGVPMRQALASGVAIAVAAVPEGLPLVATVAQLAAARRLSHHGVLVRSSRSLEALGRVDTLCFDKTGTLTQGKLSVSRLADVDGDLEFDASEGRHLLRVAARACPPTVGGKPRAVAHATDGAVIEASLEHTGPDTAWRLRAELPFETNRGYAASVGTNSSQVFVAVKGAPETVLAACSAIRGRSSGTQRLTPARRRAAVEAVARLAGQGLRVLAIAEGHPVVADLDDIDVAPLVAGLTLVGFVAIADTPRPTAAEAIRRLTAAGVRIAMITGDHPSTAAAIAEQLGIPDAHLVLTGSELDKLPKTRRAARIAATTVFARISPEQKVRIVQALQEAGHVVAMTGDGSNDAAAIRLADVGIAMAGHGSASARSAADLVMADADPARIAEALLEGRAMWGSVRDAASILVGGNAGEVAFTVLGTALGGRAPLGTRQLLLVNMLTDMMPALAVALAPGRARGDEALLADGPVAALWGPALARNLAVRGGATALGATMAWSCGRMTGRQRRASTMGLGALVGTQLGQTLVAGRHSPLVAVTGIASALALFAIVETPGVSQFFGCTPLGPAAWGIVLGSSAAATLAAVLAPGVLDRFGVGVAA